MTTAMTERHHPRARFHAAAGARVLTTGMSVAAAVGLMGAMGVAARGQPTQTSEPSTVILRQVVVPQGRSVIYVHEEGAPPEARSVELPVTPRPVVGDVLAPPPPRVEALDVRCTRSSVRGDGDCVSYLDRRRSATCSGHWSGSGCRDRAAMESIHSRVRHQSPQPGTWQPNRGVRRHAPTPRNGYLRMAGHRGSIRPHRHRALGYDRSFGARGFGDSSGTARPAPGCEGIEIDKADRTVRLPLGVRFDAGGIGKGLAADIVSEEMWESEAEQVLVNLGGDVRVLGAPVCVVVHEPASGACPCEIVLEDGALATSTDGPRTVATAIAGTAWWAEALTISLLVGGSGAGFGAPWRLVHEDGSVRTGGAFGTYVRTGVPHE